jgi:hypothetical protein
VSKSETRSKVGYSQHQSKSSRLTSKGPGHAGVNVSEFTTASVTNRVSRGASVSLENPIKICWFSQILSEDKLNPEGTESHPFNHTFARGAVIKVDVSTLFLPNENLQYKIDSVFGPADPIENIFDKLRDNIGKLLTGKSFMYLATGPKASGKTHTIQGVRHAPGILPKSLEYLFACIESKNLSGQIVITCNVLEVNDKGYVDIISCINKSNYRAKYKEYLRLREITSVHNILKETIKYRKNKSEYLDQSHFVITFNIEKMIEKTGSKSASYKLLSKFSIIELSNNVSDSETISISPDFLGSRGNGSKGLVNAKSNPEDGN